MKKFWISILVFAAIGYAGFVGNYVFQPVEAQQGSPVLSTQGIEIARGRVTNTSLLEMDGGNIDVATAWEPLWDEGDARTYIATAATVQATSSSGSDTHTIHIYGCDANYDLLDEEITLTGQTIKDSVGLYWRVWQIRNSSGTDSVGDIYISIDGATIASGVPSTQGQILGKILIGNGRSLALLRTIPDGYTGYMTSSDFYAGIATPTSWRVRLREEGGVFQTIHFATTQLSQAHRIWQIPLVIPEHADVVVEGKVGTGTGALSGDIDIILIKGG